MWWSEWSGLAWPERWQGRVGERGQRLRSGNKKG
jgi:hypothetical protein